MSFKSVQKYNKNNRKTVTMKTITMLTISFCVSVLVSYAQVKNANTVTVPISLDHNRILVDAEMQ